jgi:hypothetical protein
MAIEKPKESALEKVNKIITGICAFLLVLVFNDIRTQISDIRIEMKQTFNQLTISDGQTQEKYNALNTRVTLIEYTLKLPDTKQTNTKNIDVKTNKIDTVESLFNSLVFIKPQEYEFARKNPKNTTL